MPRCVTNDVSASDDASLELPSEKRLLKTLDKIFPRISDWTNPTLVSHVFRLLEHRFGFLLTLDQQELVIHEIKTARKKHVKAESRRCRGCQAQAQAQRSSSHNKKRKTNSTAAVKGPFSDTDSDQYSDSELENLESDNDRSEAEEVVAELEPPVNEVVVRAEYIPRIRFEYTLDESKAIMQGVDWAVKRYDDPDEWKLSQDPEKWTRIRQKMSPRLDKLTRLQIRDKYGTMMKQKKIEKRRDNEWERKHRNNVM